MWNTIVNTFMGVMFIVGAFGLRKIARDMASGKWSPWMIAQFIRSTSKLWFIVGGINFVVGSIGLMML